MIRDWYTANIIHKNFLKLDFFTNFKTFNLELYETYVEVETFYSSNHSNSLLFYGRDKNEDLMKVFNSISEFQLFLREDNTQEEIEAKSLDLFSEAYTDAEMLNIDIYDKYNMLLEYAEIAGPLLNYIEFLTSNYPYDCIVKPELETEINDFLSRKGLDTFNDGYKELLNNNKQNQD